MKFRKKFKDQNQTNNGLILSKWEQINNSIPIP